MKAMYSLGAVRSETITIDGINNSTQLNDSFKIPDELNDEFENEVKNLYAWTKNLSISDEFLNSPRRPPH
jgi:hypothetical protein